MRKSTFENDLEFANGTEAKTVVLIGGTGSKIGNKIIGANVFDVHTVKCPLQRTVVDGGQILNVILPPGLIGSFFEPKIIPECINLAKDGIHAFLVVVPFKTRTLAREAYGFESWKKVLDSNICDYMIVVITYDDALPEVYLGDFVARNWPEPLVVEDEAKKFQQRSELLRLIDSVVDSNGGVPFTNYPFVDSPEIFECEEAYKEQLKLFTEKNEATLRERTLGLEKQLADEQVARILAEAKAQEVQIKSRFEINMLRKDLYWARREAEELRDSRRESEVMLEETKDRFKEIEEIFKETEQNFDETKEKFKEMDEIFKKMEQKFAVKFKETEKN